MEKELNLVELWKDAPKGTKLYSPIFGECELKAIDGDLIYVGVSVADCCKIFFENGEYYDGGECLLFPSKENRDWRTFKVEKEGFKVGDHIKDNQSDKVFVLTHQEGVSFWANLVSYSSTETYLSRVIDKSRLCEYEKVSKFDPKWLKPFDRVLFYDSIWVATLFSHLTNIKDYTYIMCNGEAYKHCIPFNDETKHLIGTIEDEPEFYKI